MFAQLDLVNGCCNWAVAFDDGVIEVILGKNI